MNLAIYLEIAIIIFIPLAEAGFEDGGCNTSSKCRCGIDPNDANPGVRPWTVFVHVPRKKIASIGTIVSSNVIIVNHVILFDPEGKFDSDTPGVYPYHAGAKEVDINKIKVTQTVSPDSQSYKVVGVDILRRFVESHPEDTSPPVDMAAIIVDHNFASGEGPKWPICLPKPEHIGSVNELSLTPPDGVSNDEKLNIRSTDACNKDIKTEGRPPSWSPAHWEAVCVSTKSNPWYQVGANSIPATYKDGNIHYIYSKPWVQYYKPPHYFFLSNIKYAKPLLEEIIRKSGSKLCNG